MVSFCTAEQVAEDDTGNVHKGRQSMAIVFANKEFVFFVVDHKGMVVN